MSLPFLFPLLLLLLLLISYRIVFTKKPNLPPSPFRLPITGNLHQLSSLPHRSLLTLSQKHGPLMLLQFGQVPTLIVSSADMAREILKTHDLTFASRPTSKAARKLTYDSTNVSFSPYGEYWRQVKRISVQHLLNPKRVQSYRTLREEAVAVMIRRIASGAAAAVDLSEILYCYSYDVISQAASGKKEGRTGNKFRELMEEGSVLLAGFQVDDLFPALGFLSKLTGMDAKLEMMSRKWDSYLSSIVEDHVKGRGKDRDGEQDFVDVLLSLQRDNSNDFVLTENNIKAIVMDMIAAGTDTSYVVLEWAMAELVRNPRVMKKAQDEVREISKGKPMSTEDDVSQMNYMKAVLKEVLRLHPPAPILVPHESTKTIFLQGYQIPAKTRVIVNAWAIGRDPKSWEAPDEFQPERFIGSSIDFKGHDFQFIPFSAGRRVCPGMHFAISSIELALANLLYHFNWSLPDGMSAENLDMEEAPGLTTAKKLKLVLEWSTSSSVTVGS